ncbi:MAG: DEAD/DEAH box helicase family protein, partial [Oscillospiraceae bacterium]|nr:DEAD/DEAH box helicase family protein [Oscillospiraceae bacterium]
MNDTSMPIRAAPFKHQSAAYAAALDTFDSGKSRGYGLLFEMGCGKSLTAVAIAGTLYLERRIRRVLVVAPLSIVGVWREEFEKFADFNYSLAVLTGTSAKKAEQLRELEWYPLRDDPAPLQIAVVNYESAWRLEAELAKWKPELIIADEGHKIKSHSTNAAKALHRLGAKARYRLLLTGTVITNKALDVFSQYKFLNPAVFGTSFIAFRNRYFDMTGYGSYTPVLKRDREPELTEKLHSIAFRATKAECLDLPATTDIVRYVELEPAAAKLYRDLVRDSYA